MASSNLASRPPGGAIVDAMQDEATTVSPWTEPAFRARAVARLHRAPVDSIFDPRSGRSWGPSDFDLNPDLLSDLAVMEEPRPAAVLVPVVARSELTVLLTQRTEHLAKHAGQISFPGGKIDEEDVGPIDAAIREAEEEIGLSASYIETLGFLDSYRTGTGYRITPVVALVRQGFSLALNAHEVADVFEVPLSFLMDEANHQRHAREWRGRQRQFYAMPYQDRYIWGATAGIIKNLHERLIAR